jgi:Tfp pilus assembly protein PilE
MKRSRISAGFTLMELLIVAAIIMILIFVMGYLSLPKYIQRARDAERKTDLEEYRIHLEEYFTDKNSYPPEDVMDNRDDCNTGNLQPYMDRILCDPSTGEPYIYEVSPDGQHYWIYATLTDDSDPTIGAIGCSQGCGPDNNGDSIPDYNYGVSDGALPGQDVQDGSVTPYCACTPGQCGTCCPGAKYRCNADATGCYYDAGCQSGN